MSKSGLLLPALLAAMLLVAITACGDDDSDSPATSEPAGSAATDPATSAEPTDDGDVPETGVNALLNPGFEDGQQGWNTAKNPFTVTSEQALSGSAAAELTMRDTTESPVTNTYTFFQEITPAEFPEVLSFNYLVKHWVKGTAKQYISVTVIAYGGTDAFPDCPGETPDECPNYQIRYILGGVSQNPIQVENAKYIYVSRDEPSLDEWVPVTRDLERDFQNTWGAIPKNPEKVRIVAEVRYDDRQGDDGPMEADVYFDDMFLGTRG